MRTPREEEDDPETGRILTEWFEEKEHSPALIDALAREKAGFSPDEFIPDLHRSSSEWFALDDETRLKLIKYQAAKASFSRRRWRNGMTQQEVAHRMNEATKMVNPDNNKFLDTETSQRTGLTLNPLWQMECLYRSGILTPKDQISILKTLADYTHSKAATINVNNNNNTHEDWIMQLAKDEYKEVLPEKLPEDRKQPRENKHGPLYEKRRQQKLDAIEEATVKFDIEMGSLSEELEGIEIPEIDPDELQP